MDCRSLQTRLRFAFEVVWCLLVGVSVPVGLVNSAHLNRLSDKPEYNAFYVGQIAVFIGGLVVLPTAVMAPKPWGRPKKWWSLLGGACVLPAFFSISGSALLGTQLVLVAMLGGQLVTALALDLVDGSYRCSEKLRTLGFVVAVSGLALDCASGKDGDKPLSAYSIAVLLAVFAGGVGYSFQSKCNTELGLDFGHPMRAIGFCALVSNTCAVPLALLIALRLGVPPQLSAGDWANWAFSGFQSAFYIGSFAYLPKRIGYATTVTLVLAGKLLTSTVIDAYGLAGAQVPVGLAKVVSLVLVFAGATQFSRTAGPPQDDATVATAQGSDDLQAGECVGDGRSPLKCEALAGFSTEA